MPKPPYATLSRRERQIMDVLHRRGRSTAAEVRTELAGNPSDSTVRTQLRILEDKGHVRHEAEGLRYVYAAAVARQTARRHALRHVVETFFDGSTGQVVGALLGADNIRLSDAELKRIADIVAKARKGAAK